MFGVRPYTKDTIGSEQIGCLMSDKMYVLAAAWPSHVAFPPSHCFSLFVYCFHQMTVFALKPSHVLPEKYVSVFSKSADEVFSEVFAK